MISILIVGHGRFASGLYYSLKMLFGVNENISYIDFDENETSETLKEKVKLEISKFNEKCRSVICLTDIKGGTPFKICSELSLILENKIEVISGTNMPMLLSLATQLDDLTLSEAVNESIDTGRSEIDVFKLKIRNDEEIIDGI